MKITKENYQNYSPKELGDSIYKILCEIDFSNNSIHSFYSNLFYAILMQSDILNGGFNQYFHNQIEHVDSARIGLNAMNYTKTIKLLDDALTKYNKEIESKEVEEIDFSKYDGNFYSLTENDKYWDKLDDYIIKNIHFFFPERLDYLFEKKRGEKNIINQRIIKEYILNDVVVNNVYAFMFPFKRRYVDT